MFGRSQPLRCLCLAQFGGPGHLIQLFLDVEDIGPFPVARLRDAIAQLEQLGIFAQIPLNFRGRPGVKLALFAFAVGVVAAVETAIFVTQFAHHKVQRFLDDTTVERLLRYLISVQVGAGQQGVVVQHLLEVGHQPFFIGGVAGKATTDLVVHAAVGHLFERGFGHVQGAAVFVQHKALQQIFQRHGWREFGCAAKTTALVIEGLGQRSRGFAKHAGAQHIFFAGEYGRSLQMLGNLARTLDDFAALRFPGVDNALHQLDEAGHAVTWGWRKIGAAVKRPSFRREEYSHRPATLAGHGYHCLHVNRVQIGALFTVNFNVDEMRVHVVSSGFILKRFMGHNVAPVAGRVANAEQNRFVFLAGAVQRVLAPGIPIDGIINVLQQIWAGFLR